MFLFISITSDQPALFHSYTLFTLSLSLYLLNRRLFIHRYYMSVEVFRRVYQLIVRAAAA